FAWLPPGKRRREDRVRPLEFRGTRNSDYLSCCWVQIRGFEYERKIDRSLVALRSTYQRTAFSRTRSQSSGSPPSERAYACPAAAILWRKLLLSQTCRIVERKWAGSSALKNTASSSSTSEVPGPRLRSTHFPSSMLFK